MNFYTKLLFIENLIGLTNFKSCLAGQVIISENYSRSFQEFSGSLEEVFELNVPVIPVVFAGKYLEFVRDFASLE